MNSTLENIKERINKAARQAGRDPQEITLAAVSKRQSKEAIENLHAQGQMVFAENYLQEAQEKIKTINRPLTWHFIGHIQSNKAAQIAELFQVVHTVDRLKVAKLLANKAAALGKTLDIYIQVNIGREPQKSGVPPEALLPLANDISALKSLNLVGLMAMPPFSQDPEASRPYFREMRQLACDLQENIPTLPRQIDLSMGMSGDFETAIAEGATIVRVGTALFGERL